MIFRRTANGISNQHKFVNVDAIVFVEGGESYSKAEVYDGKFDISIDIQFWRGLFYIYGEGKRLQFRAIGSKATLMSIAEDIEAGKINNTYIAIDRDFDSINGKLIENKNVFYTYGYSWENDVWQLEIINDVFNTIAIYNDMILDIKDKMSTIYHKFFKEIKLAVYADAFLSKNGIGFFPRPGHLRCLNVEHRAEPCVNTSTVDQLLLNYNLSKKEINNFGITYEINPQCDCYGHLFSDFCYFMITHFLRKICKLASNPKHYILSIGIDKFFLKLKDNKFPYLDLYYKLQFLS